jgi:two-component sensor histidine kinase
MKTSACTEYFILILLLVGNSFGINAQTPLYTDVEVKKAERSLTGLKGVDKIKTLLKLSAWYETYYYKPKEFQKAFDYANEALSFSRALHSDIYEGKSYLQLSMLYEIRNDDEMLENCARNAIALLTETNQMDDLAEAWIMVWSAKMRSNAPLEEKIVPIRQALALFKLSGNNKRSSDCYREIGALYFRYKDFPKAMNSLEKAMVLYKTANLEEKDFYPVSFRLNILYETEKKNQDITILKNKALLQQNELKSAAFLRNSMITFLLLLLIILGLLYKRFEFKKKTNRLLEVQQEEIGQKNVTLQNILIEKEWLLREIHHRVKNNLHMVMGLLESQAEFLKNDEAIQAIHSSQNRIHSMSLIHQKLYQSEDLSMINMPSYLLELSEYLKDSFNIGKSVRFTLDVDNFDLPLSHSIPIGLIFNEAVTNSIKYAFPSVFEARIDIWLKTEDNTNFTLVIKDNGIGLPSDFDPYDNPSLGIKLMQGLAEDIGAKFRIINKNGTKVSLKFIINESNLH